CRVDGWPHPRRATIKVAPTGLFPASRCIMLALHTVGATLMVARVQVPRACLVEVGHTPRRATLMVAPTVQLLAVMLLILWEGWASNSPPVLEQDMECRNRLLA